MRYSRVSWAFLLGIIVSILVACSTLGLEGPKSPAEKIAAGYATAEAVNRTASQLLREKKISSGDAQNVLSTTQSVRQGLDLARTLDPKAADTKIQTQLEMLRLIQKYLAERGAK